MKRIEDFSLSDFDVLQEVGNIGASHAATALSQLIDRKINMSVPSVNCVDFNELMEIVGGHEKNIVSISLQVEGDVPGSMFFVLTPEEAVVLAQQVTGDSSIGVYHLQDHPLTQSALSEVGNILSGSYLSTLSDFTKLQMQPTVPQLSIDMAAAILMQGILEISEESDFALVIDTIIREEGNWNESVTGQFFFIPDPDSFSKIFHALGVAGS
ncbi:chemotaxis protein CheC [Gracilibacillus sp. YIM 98692]|uniref:chemotaxis protein CheC n=1 Tax=Gracilibacillus sp. YIM 98692 TaxID=2663532 RepID=UPI0013D4B391|nr:chemotaxis protein CheC [Gracilibacillus sp. YIM 98692]